MSMYKDYKNSGGFAGMSKPFQDWLCLDMTPEDLEWGKQQLAKVLAAGNTAPDRNFGNKSAGFAAERVFDRWLNEEGIAHTWNSDPVDRTPDFEIRGATIDLKTHVTNGGPRPHYDANLTEEQRVNSGHRDWYLFAKLDKSNMTDLWILGLQTEAVILEKGVYYREGQVTRLKMDAPCDCWCIRFDELIKLPEWLGEYG